MHPLSRYILKSRNLEKHTKGEKIVRWAIGCWPQYKDMPISEIDEGVIKLFYTLGLPDTMVMFTENRTIELHVPNGWWETVEQYVGPLGPVYASVPVGPDIKAAVERGAELDRIFHFTFWDNIDRIKWVGGAGQVTKEFIEDQCEVTK